jgi:hypothetical protein
MRAFEGNFGWIDASKDKFVIDVVVATWSTRGGKIAGPLSQVRMRSVFPDRIYDAFPPSWIGGGLHHGLPGLFDRVMQRANQDRITREQVLAEVPATTVHIEERLPFKWFEHPTAGSSRLRSRDPFSMQMLYKIWQADMLRKNLESEKGLRYDIVVRARPDSPPAGLDGAILAQVEPGILYLDFVHHDQRTAGDFFALGDSKTMEVYGNFFLEAMRRAKEGTWNTIHYDLYDYLAGAGLQLKQYNPS